MESIPAACAMDWSIDLDKGLRSRHLGTRLKALEAAAPRIRDLAASPSVPAAVASAFGVLPAEPRVFAETMLLRLATEFRAATDDSVRARIVRALLPAQGAAWACAEPDQILRKVAAAHGAAGTPRARELALRMFGCLADLAKDSVHVRSLVLSGLRSSNAAEVKAALFAAGCFCKLSEDFSYITLQMLSGLVISPASEAQVIMAAIKTFSKLDCKLAVIRRVHEVGKQLVLGNLEDVFKAEILFALSRLASKSIVLFGDQAALLLSFLGHESSLPMKTMVLKCLCFMFRRNTLYPAVASTVFGTLLLHLIDDEGFPLDCKSYAFRILQKTLCVKEPSICHIKAPELSKLALSAKRFLHCSSWEMQYTALEFLLDIFFCFLKQTKLHQTISTLESSSFSYTGYQGISNNMLSTHEAREDEKSLNMILTAIVDNIMSLANQLANCRSKEVVPSCELQKYRALFSLMLKLVSGYPSAASASLDKVRCLMKELARINACHYSGVAANCVESSVSPEQFRTSYDTVEPAVRSIKASCMEIDTDKAKLASTEFCSKNNSSVVHDLIICTLKFANACHDMCHKTSGSSGNLHHNVKGLTECVQQNAPQYCSTYEFFGLIMCAHISWSTYKIRDGNKGSGDSNEDPKIYFTPAWIAHELCALRMAKMLTRKQSYWEAYRSAMYCCHEDFSNVPGSSEPCRLEERFSHASILQDLHRRVDRNDSQVFSELRQFISVSSYELNSVHFSTRMNLSGKLEKDSYSLFKFAVASLLRARVDAKGVTTGEDALHHLHRAMQLLSGILQRFMELPFVLPRHFFSVRPCLGAELFMFDSNPVNKNRISVPPGFQLSLTLCLQWKRVLERTPTRIAKLYCVLATSPSSPLHMAGTRSKHFEMRRTTSEMVGLHSELLQHIKSGGLRKTGGEKSSRFSSETTGLAMAFASFKPAGGGQGFSDCMLDVSSFRRGEHQIAWQACCVDENGRCFSLLPLNDGAVFSVQ
ncbi:uncharacterized protein LOC123442720 isoform X2 [Hordeum vulgare subsp. vulgare]|uniref:uncharacterized protein LOC123442720 isoform X2 n=1 Tax=Hordeum vulgare subsp. vulgare TaxID=112509 RepID=UPI001D1A3C37|nr:uncharacterized protein LOC123442720 isoform X2 [Hordeum vulgare subsp. vulgare]